MRWALALLAWLVLAACGASSPPVPTRTAEPTGAPSTVVEPAGTPPPATPTGAPIAAATATPVPTRTPRQQPTFTPTPTVAPLARKPACAPSSETNAPFADRVTFPDSQHAVLLGHGLLRVAGTKFDCAYVAATSDGGKTWQKVPDFDIVIAAGPLAEQGRAWHGVSDIVFATPTDGWLYGPGLWVTHDGGQTWKDESDVFGRTYSVLVDGGQAELRNQDASGAGWRFRAWAGSGWEWKAFAPAHGYQFVEHPRSVKWTGLLDGWVLALVDLSASPAATLWVTHDGGETWRELPPPPKPRGLTAVGVEALGDTVWLSYEGQGGGGMISKEIERSDDGGLTWTPLASPGGGNTLDGVVAATHEALFLRKGRSTLDGSFDGGATWVHVLPPGDPSIARGDTSAAMGFGADGLHGLASGGPWWTEDGGHTWRLLQLPREP